MAFYALATLLRYIRHVQNRRFPAAEELITDVNASASNARNWLNLAHALIDVAAHTDANPYGLLDVLEEGIASAVLVLPPGKRRATAAAVMRLLLDQFRSNGID